MLCIPYFAMRVGCFLLKIFPSSTNYLFQCSFTYMQQIMYLYVYGTIFSFKLCSRYSSSSKNFHFSYVCMVYISLLASLDSTAQTGHANGVDWQEEVYQKVKLS